MYVPHQRANGMSQPLAIGSWCFCLWSCLLASLCLSPLLLAPIHDGVRVAIVADSFSLATSRSSRSSHRCRVGDSATWSPISIGSKRKCDFGRTFAFSSQNDNNESNPMEPDGQCPRAVLLVGSFSQSTEADEDEEQQRWLHALKAAGYADAVISASRSSSNSSSNNNNGVYFYEISRATGMLKLVSSSASSMLSLQQQVGGTDSNIDGFEPPRWIPMVRGEEKVLVENGWSFLDPDESEPLSSFDIDDANVEGEYRPKWRKDNEKIDACGVPTDDADAATTPLHLSPLGYDISPLSEEEILIQAESLSENNVHSRGVLLYGETEPPHTKTTCNGFDFAGPSGQLDIPRGIFFTAIGDLPLFSSTDLSPTTGSSGWLSFSRPLEASHVQHISPDDEQKQNDYASSSLTMKDQRIEVVCARSGCHLGHYFGPTEGYCINASALRFIPGDDPREDNKICLSVSYMPISWRPLDEGLPQSLQQQLPLPSHRLLRKVLETHGRFERVALGCGCFWHVEGALRQLHGVVETEACYAGGYTLSPSYEAVCGGTTGHAEVVSVVYDPEICERDVLFDCFLAMHDPTMVRAHGKHAKHTGQYRSCIFVETAATEKAAEDCLEICKQQLGRDLRTEIRRMDDRSSDHHHQQQQSTVAATTRAFGEGWCWRAEDIHQRREERVRRGRQNVRPKIPPPAITTALSAVEWLEVYGRRSPSIVGSSTSIEASLHPEDDGLAMMMI